MKTALKITISFLLVCISQQLLSQEELIKQLQDSIKRIDSELRIIRSDYYDLSGKIDSISLVQATGADTEDDLQKLLEEAEQLAAAEKEEDLGASKKFHSGMRQQQALNPNISVGGDFFVTKSSANESYLNEPGEASYGNNGLFLREMEVAFVAPLDPFTRGKSFISVTKADISIEEAYMEWLNLPLNMNLKAGIFYCEFGPLNRYHDHALPQFDRPRALVNLFSNKGLGGTGLAASFMLPKILFAQASSLDLSFMKGSRSDDRYSFNERELLYVGQFKNFYDITTNSYFEVRISGALGRNPEGDDNHSAVGSLGLEYKWVPAGREKYRTFDWKTELLYCSYETPTGRIKSKGFYTSVQNKVSARFWIGGRIGYSELPFDRNQNEWDFTLNIDFWQSEFVFTRLQYQYNSRNIINPDGPIFGNMPNDHTLLLQVCWAMGPHKHESY